MTNIKEGEGRRACTSPLFLLSPPKELRQPYLRRSTAALSAPLFIFERPLIPRRLASLRSCSFVRSLPCAMRYLPSFSNFKVS